MRLILILFTLLFAAAPDSSNAQKSPEKIRLSTASKDGAVLLRVPIQPFDYALQFSKNGKSGFGSRVYIMKVRASTDGYAYIARTLDPGRYRLDSIWQQGAWGLCLEQGTFAFDVHAGKIAFLGTFHTDQMLLTIQKKAVDAGQTDVKGTDYHISRDHQELPVVDGRDESGTKAAVAFADSIMGGSGALVELANMSDTSFGTSGFGRAIKICG
jgi:hypothetical protein